jgi:hypothetical protein
MAHPKMKYPIQLEKTHKTLQIANVDVQDIKKIQLYALQNDVKMCNLFTHLISKIEELNIKYDRECLTHSITINQMQNYRDKLKITTKKQKTK